MASIPEASPELIARLRQPDTVRAAFTAVYIGLRGYVDSAFVLVQRNSGSLFLAFDESDAFINGYFVKPCRNDKRAAILPERPELEHPDEINTEGKRPLWNIVRPYVYMAAMFAGVWLFR